MLRQQNHTQISCDTLYLAFRAALVTTVDLLLLDLPLGTTDQPRGFLERLPLLSGCAPQVQLECLLNTWRQLYSGAASPSLNDLDRCICYCAAAELAQLGTNEDSRRIEQAIAGPRSLEHIDLLWLASKLRTIQITWPFDHDCGTVLRDGNFLDGNLDETPSISLHGTTASQMLELSGCWFVSPRIFANSAGLITEDERGKLANFFQQHPGLMNL